MKTQAIICFPALMLAHAVVPALPAQAQSAVSAHPRLATAAQTRQSILAQLAAKAGQPPYDKALPLLQKAQAELAASDPASHTAAIADAYDAALLVMTQTDNHALAARLFDGFLLPHLSSASPDPSRYNGRLHLLKIAASVYGQAGMPDRQLAVLTLLRREAADNENLEDWVSLQLSALYAQRKQYAPAADALAAVKTPEMIGPVSSFEDLEQKADEQKTALKVDSIKARSHKAAHVKSRQKRPARHRII